MRIGVNAYFLGHPHTGSGQYLAELARRLPAQRPDWEFVWYVPAGLRISEGMVDCPLGVPGPPLARGNWAKLYFEQAGFPRQAVQDGCDLLFVPYLGPPALEAERAVVTVHDTIPLLLPSYRHGVLPQAYASLVKANARRCRLLLADSHWTKRDAVQTMAVRAAQVRVVPLGVSGDLVPVRDGANLEAVRQRYRLPDEYVIYVGGYDRRKRVDVLLQAYALLAQRLPEAPPLVLAGKLPERSGPAVPDMRRLVEQSGLGERLVLAGPVAEGDKAALLSAARAFAFPSEYEGFGLPPLEAMACGTPVVAANAASVPEVCGEGALLVPPGDAAALSTAMERLLTDPGLAARLAGAGLSRAACYTWERTTELTALALAEAGETKTT